MCQGRHSGPTHPGADCPPPAGGGLSSLTCLSLQGEDLRGRIHTSPKSSLDLPPQKTLAWSASLTIHLLFPRITPILHSTGVYVYMCGRELTLLSNFSSWTPSLLRVHRPGSHHLHSAQAWCQSPDTVQLFTLP